MDGVERPFPGAGFREMDKKPIAGKTGATGLRSVIESVLGSSMFEVPSDPRIERVVIDAPCVLGEAAPEYIRGEGRLRPAEAIPIDGHPEEIA